MSRIGKEPINFSANVDVSLNGNKINIKGSKGESFYMTPDCIHVEVNENQIVVSRGDDKKFSKAMFGTVRSLINNMIVGVTEGYKKNLIIEGVGYKAQLKGNEIVLSLGFSHDIVYKIPDGITINVDSGTNISVEGIDKQLVGQVAARIRDYSPVEPYKGKGIFIDNEHVVRKERKKAAAAG
mgnify:FL=1